MTFGEGIHLGLSGLGKDAVLTSSDVSMNCKASDTFAVVQPSFNQTQFKDRSLIASRHTCLYGLAGTQLTCMQPGAYVKPCIMISGNKQRVANPQTVGA